MHPLPASPITYKYRGGSQIDPFQYRGHDKQTEQVTSWKGRADNLQPSTNNNSNCMSRTTKPRHLRNTVLFAMKNIRELFVTLLQKYIQSLRKLIPLKQITETETSIFIINGIFKLQN